MKRTLIALLFLTIPTVLFAYTSPGKPLGQVNDFAGILSASDITTLESELDAFGLQTSFSVVVATVPSLGDETIETYATKLFEEWGIGGAEKDTGVLILVAPNEREVRIETGYGAQGDLTDLQSDQVIENVMIPEFKNGDYPAGIKNGARAIQAILVNSPDAKQYLTAQRGESDFNFLPFVFLFIIIINIFAKFLGKTKSWWLGGVIGAVLGVIVGLIFGLIIGAIGVVILTILGLIFDFLVSRRPPGSGGGGFWPIIFGGGHGGSGGGGFGGFGGGMSGGGGSSGRW